MRARLIHFCPGMMLSPFSLLATTVVREWLHISPSSHPLTSSSSSLYPRSSYTALNHNYLHGHTREERERLSRSKQKQHYAHKDARLEEPKVEREREGAERESMLVGEGERNLSPGACFQRLKVNHHIVVPFPPLSCSRASKRSPTLRRNAEVKKRRPFGLETFVNFPVPYVHEHTRVCSSPLSFLLHFPSAHRRHHHRHSSSSRPRGERSSQWSISRQWQRQQQQPLVRSRMLEKQGFAQHTHTHTALLCAGGICDGRARDGERGNGNGAGGRGKSDFRFRHQKKILLEKGYIRSRSSRSSSEIEQKRKVGARGSGKMASLS